MKITLKSGADILVVGRAITLRRIPMLMSRPVVLLFKSPRNACPRCIVVPDMAMNPCTY
jgi:hypothetical protein